MSEQTREALDRAQAAFERVQAVQTQARRRLEQAEERRREAFELVADGEEGAHERYAQAAQDSRTARMLLQDASVRVQEERKALDVARAEHQRAEREARREREREAEAERRRKERAREAEAERKRERREEVKADVVADFREEHGRRPHRSEIGTIQAEVQRRLEQEAEPA